MSADPGTDPLAALQRFVARVSPYDPDPAAGPPVTVGCGADTVVLTPHLARAFVEALERYRDPADRGACAGCGGPLDEHLHCPNCDRLHGVFGELVVERARRAAAGGSWTGAGDGPWTGVADG